MAVYVDNARIPYRYWLSSHMMADSTDELIDMAEAVGLQAKWIQAAGTYREHFDLSQGKRAEAIRRGAIPLTLRETGKMLIARREKRAESV